MIDYFHWLAFSLLMIGGVYTYLEHIDGTVEPIPSGNEIFFPGFGGLVVREIASKEEQAVVYTTIGGQFSIREFSTRAALAREVMFLTSLEGTPGIPEIRASHPTLPMVVIDPVIPSAELPTNWRLLGSVMKFEIIHQLIDLVQGCHDAGFILGGVLSSPNLIMAKGDVPTITINKRFYNVIIRGANEPYPKDSDGVYLSSPGEMWGESPQPVDDMYRLMYLLVSELYAPLPWADPNLDVGKTKNQFAQNRIFFERYNIPSGFAFVLKYLDTVRDGKVDYQFIRETINRSR